MSDLMRPDVVKKGDGAILRYRANADLSAASSITWLCRVAPDDAVLHSVEATVVEVENATTVVQVVLTPTETAAVGMFLCEVEAMVGGVPYTFPSEGYQRLRVIDDLS